MSCYEIIIDTDNIQEERWAPIEIKGKIFPYHVSDFGRIKVNKTGKLLKYSFDARAYPQVILTHQGERVGKRVHLLVAAAFVSNSDPDNKTYVNHIDGRKGNPKYNNLEWCTHQENITHRDNTGLAKPFDSTNHPFRKPVIQISTGKIFNTVTEAAAHAGIKHLYQYLCGQIKSSCDYKYYEPTKDLDEWTLS